MYLRGLSACSDCNGQLNGLGWIQYAALAYDAYSKSQDKGGGGGSGGGGAGSAPNVTATTTNVNTQVSPQISPQFIQQQQPQNSAVNAGVSMTPSAIPMTGSLPGFDNYPAYAPTGSIPMPQQQAKPFNYAWLLVPVGVIGLVMVLRRNRK